MMGLSFDVNWVSVFTAAVASMALGFFWYSEMFLGKPWMREMGFTKKSMKKAQKDMGPMYALSFAAAVLTAFILYNFFALGMDMYQTAFWLWLGFIMPVQLVDVIFNKKQMWTVFAVNTSYQLASLALMSLVIGFLG